MSDILFYFQNKEKYVPDTQKTAKWQECMRKKAYTSQNKAMNTLIKYHGRNNNTVHVYECPHCYFYHIGHIPGNRKKDINND